MPGVLTVCDEGATRRCVFEQQAVVGRDLAGATPLTSRSVSRRHALVEKTPNGWVVRDLGSANGTSVGGARVKEGPRVTGAAVRKAPPVAVCLATTVGVILLAAATIWARYCDRAPAKASAASRAPALIGRART